MNPEDEGVSSKIISLVEGDAFKNATSKIPEKLLEMSEEELRKLAHPTKTDYALRSALWNELRIAARTGVTLKPGRVYGGICSYTHWWANVLRVPTKLAWIIQPLQSYERSLEPFLPRITERLDELLNINIYDRRGRVVPSLAKVLLHTIGLVETRLRGGAIQRVESKNLNLSIGNSVQDESESQPTMEELDAQIKELETRLAEPPNSIRNMNSVKSNFPR